MKKTPARLELLQAVADGAVWRSGTTPWDYLDRKPGASYLTVDSRVAALARAGLVELLAGLGRRAWALTDAGRDLLVEWGGTP